MRYAVAICLFVCIVAVAWLTDRQVRPVGPSMPASADVPPSEIAAAPRLWPTVAAASNTPVAPTQTAELPKNIDEAKAAIPGLREGLDRVSPINRQMLAMKMELVTAVRDCVAGRVTAGYVNVGLHFKLAEDDRQYQPAIVQSLGGTLEGDERELVLSCVVRSFTHPVTLEPDDAVGPEYLLGTQFRFPVEDDPVYAYVRQVARGTSDGILVR